MNRKQFIFVLLALAFIGGSGLILFKRNKQTWAVHEAKVGDKALPGFRFNDVAAIHVKGFDDFNIVRRDGIWRIPERMDYPANFSVVSDLLLKIKDLKVVQSEIIGPSLLARVDLDETNRTLVEFKDAQGKMIASMIVGKKHDRPQKDNEPLGIHGFWDGRYIVLPEDPGNVLLVSDELGSIIPEPGPWLNTDFFKVVNIKFISVTAKNQTNSWSLLRETLSAPWTLPDAQPGEVLNPTRAAVCAEMLEFPRFVDVAPNTPPYSTNWGLDQPTVINVIADQLAYTLKVGSKRQSGNYHMTVAVTADLPAQRVPGKDETAAEKEKLDDEFEKKNREIRAKLAKEQPLSSWIFEVDPWIEMVMRDRAQLLQADPPPPAN